MREFLRSGDPFVWLAGSGLALCLLMVAGLVAVVLVNGLGFFWPGRLERLELADGRVFLAEIVDRREIPGREGAFRLQAKVGNRDVYGLDFLWIEESDLRRRARPQEAAVFERLEWGNAHGYLRRVEVDGVAAGTGAGAWEALERARDRTDRLRERIEALEDGELRSVDAEVEALRLDRRRLERSGAPEAAVAAIDARRELLWQRYEELAAVLADLRRESDGWVAAVEVPGGGERRLQVARIVRAWRPNAMDLPARCGVYAARLGEFLAGQPRESNTGGGIFPALFGTVMMVFLMTLAVVPFGVLAALYLREYARQGLLVRAVRIAVNNLAGVPSIVFGMFGLGFFVYGAGGLIDRLFYPEALPAPTFGTGGILWASLTLALLTLPVVIVATEEALSAVPAGLREGSLALGSTKLQMVWRVLIPGALPGILTGVILATARGAGEVAPLMITGVVKLAPDLPLDGIFPFLHLERKFMHLGFHIYDVGFQSPNVEAARPMVYSTTLLLLMVVLVLNLTAVVVRGRLRRRHAVTAL